MSFPVVLVLALAAAVGIGVALGLRSGGDGPADPPPLSLPATPPATTTAEGETASDTPRALFTHNCGACHALRAAGTTSRVGPDLDALAPSAARVRRMIRTGSLDGVMQRNLVRGDDARRVSAYVARVAAAR